MKRCILLIYLVSVTILLYFSCTTPQQIYIQDAERDSVFTIINGYSTTIHPGDNLEISIYSKTPESTISFNRGMNPVTVPNQKSTFYVRSNEVNRYWVRNDGTLLFPLMEPLSVAGLTKDSLANLIQNILIEKDYVKDPVVTVNLINFRVSVVGEVVMPQELHVEGERLTIFEALAMCGDITKYGQRDNIIVIRVCDGMAKPIAVDLTQKSIFDSEVYYLQSNDIVYIEPNKVKKKVSQIKYENTSYAVTLLSISFLIRNLVYMWSNIVNQ